MWYAYLHALYTGTTPQNAPFVGLLRHWQWLCLLALRSWPKLGTAAITVITTLPESPG